MGHPASGSWTRLPSFALHVLGFTLFVYVWHWHTTPSAAGLPGASGFGWFFRYLTFCSFSLQTLCLGLCVLADAHSLLSSRGTASEFSIKQPKSSTWGFGSDTLACALFPLALTVTIMFFTIAKTTGDIVEGGATERPPWLGLTVHVVNSVLAGLDLLLSERRSFSFKSGALGSMLVAGYIGWILVVRREFGKFPYPFLEKMPMPEGFLGIAVFGIAVYTAMFAGGRVLRRTVRPGSIASSEPIAKKVA